MQDAAFRCEILLAHARAPSWPRIGDLLTTGQPKLAPSPRIEPQRGGHARLWLEDTAIEATFVGFPSPSARGVEHGAHVVLHAEAPAADARARLVLARRLMAVAATLALRRDCAGAVWNDVPGVIAVDAMRRAGQRLAAGQDPVSVWVRLVQDDGPAEGTRSTRSIGLAPFFGREIELEPGPEAADLQERVVGAVLAHAFDDGAMIEDGTTFRIEEAGDFIALLQEEGICAPGPVCLLRRLPTAEEAARALGGGQAARRRCAAIVLFDPDRLPDPAEIARAIARVDRRLGLAPEMREAAPDRLIADWGVVRGGGARRSEILYRGWALPEALVAFILAENPDVALRHPELLGASAPVLIRELLGPGAEPGILGATLTANLAAALIALPGARGMIWPTSGILAPREVAERHFRRAGADLPIGLTVARLALELAGGRRVFVTRGMAELGEREILMTCDDPGDPLMQAAFESLVGAVFRRQMQRRGPHFVNTNDGAVFELREEPIAGIGPVLKARLIEPPRPSSGLRRLLRLKD
ncbi:MAG: hypothetical protein D6686_07890 [Alphaproteobacteria bacterium]|nr:MAG: hypothetical protein D6686_07890 [Alphaproteobacteria bacterium]